MLDRWMLKRPIAWLPSCTDCRLAGAHWCISAAAPCDIMCELNLSSPVLLVS